MYEIPKRISTIVEAYANFIDRISSTAGLIQPSLFAKKVCAYMA